MVCLRHLLRDPGPSDFADEQSGQVYSGSNLRSMLRFASCFTPESRRCRAEGLLCMSWCTITFILVLQVVGSNLSAAPGKIVCCPDIIASTENRHEFRLKRSRSKISGTV